MAGQDFSLEIALLSSLLPEPLAPGSGGYLWGFGPEQDDSRGYFWATFSVTTHKGKWGIKNSTIYEEDATLEFSELIDLIRSDKWRKSHGLPLLME